MITVVLWAQRPQGPMWWEQFRMTLILGAVSVGMLLSAPHPLHHRIGWVEIPLIVICVLSRLPWAFRRGSLTVVSASIVACGLAGTALVLIAAGSPAVAFYAVAVVGAMTWWPVRNAIWFATVLAAVQAFGAQVHHSHSIWDVLSGPLIGVVAILLGTVRRQNLELVARAEEAHREHARSAALDERSRIAREIHDVLAHSLAALSVQLETADALLESGRTEQARERVQRAGALAKEGLAETRRAIGALHGDTLPLPELLATLAEAYRADHEDATATVRVDGKPRDLKPDVTLTLYRTAQEAITNVRKHAPGAAVDLALHYGSDRVRLIVSNGAGPGGDRPLRTTGGGYGLTGLRERAELAGGTIEAGPEGPGWRVDIQIPV